VSVAFAGWLDEVRRVLEHVRASDATEIEVAASEFRLRLVRRPGRAPIVTEPRAVAVDAPVAGTPLPAPLTGVFYRSSAPGSPPLAEVGDRVESGAVVGLIETMKIFNEVLAERGGRIAAILAESGQLVHAGDALMIVEDAAAPSGNEQAKP
jgi:acetyl-CoA carboxylase biotin carboxyl carrier protein